MTKHLKHLKTFEFHSITVCPFVLDGCFIWVCSIYSALKMDVKVDWSSRHFSQNFNIQIKYGFSCTNVRPGSNEIVKTKLQIWWL